MSLRLGSLSLLLVCPACLAGCAKGCGSPVAPDAGVKLNGSAGAGITIIRLSTPGCTATQAATLTVRALD